MEACSAAILKAIFEGRRSGGVAELVANILHLHRYLERDHFPLWEDHGFHLTPVHFYSPIPDTRTLGEDIWQRESQLVGVDMNDAVQLRLLEEVFPAFRAEYEQFPPGPTNLAHEFHFNNGMFDGLDALVLYCMVRQLKPNLILEAGSGFSSRLSARAALRNGNTRLVCIEPYPSEILKAGFAGMSELIEKNVQEVGLDVFQQLDARDILFIDTSHTVKCGGEVNYFFLEVIPRLKPGVVVHVHDIFFPGDYPRHWIKDWHIFWNEQYLVQSFLAFNTEYEILMCNNYLSRRYPAKLQATFAGSPWQIPGASLWMRRRSRD